MGCWWIGWNILCLLRNVDYVGWMLRDRFGGGVGGIWGEWYEFLLFSGITYYFCGRCAGIWRLSNGPRSDPLCVFVELVVVRHWITRIEFNSFQLNSICACSTQSRLIKAIASIIILEPYFMRNIKLNCECKYRVTNFIMSSNFPRWGQNQCWFRKIVYSTHAIMKRYNFCCCYLFVCMYTFWVDCV